MFHSCCDYPRSTPIVASQSGMKGSVDRFSGGGSEQHIRRRRTDQLCDLVSGGLNGRSSLGAWRVCTVWVARSFPKKWEHGCEDRREYRRRRIMIEINALHQIIPVSSVTAQPFRELRHHPIRRLCPVLQSPELKDKSERDLESRRSPRPTEISKSTDRKHEKSAYFQTLRNPY